MTLQKIDHVAIEVPDLEDYIGLFTATGGLRLIRRATALATGRRMAMLGDATGVKIELLENPTITSPLFAHIAFRADDVAATVSEAAARGWSVLRAPDALAAAMATSAFLTRDGFDFQVVEYAPESPDLMTWQE